MWIVFTVSLEYAVANKGICFKWGDGHLKLSLTPTCVSILTYKDTYIACTQHIQKGTSRDILSDIFNYLNFILLLNTNLRSNLCWRVSRRQPGLLTEEARKEGWRRRADLFPLAWLVNLSQIPWERKETAGGEECCFLSAVFYIGLQFVAFTCVWTHVKVWSMKENPQVSSKEFQTLSTAVTDILAKGPYAPTRCQAYRYCEIMSRKWANTFTSSHHTTAKQAHHTTQTHTPQHAHHSTCIDK